MSEPIRFQTTVNAEDSHRYADMRLRLILRQAVLDATDTTRDHITLDEVAQILEDEYTYLRKRMEGK